MYLIECKALCISDEILFICFFYSDINECEEHRCEQICVNLDGSFLCDCNEDFQLADDKVSCVSLKPAIQNDEKIQTIGKLYSGP